MTYKNSTRQILIPLIIALSIISGILIQKYLFYPQVNVASFSTRASKIDKLLNKIVTDYVDTVNFDSIQEKALPKIVGELDPHSVYIPASLKADVDAPMRGEFDGIGVQFNIQKDTVMVVQTIPGGPSEKVGLLAGDRIVKVNDTTIAGIKISTDDVMKRLKGKRGTKVKVGIKRNGNKDLINFTITRAEIPIFSVDVSYMVKSGIGYIKVNKFSRNTYNEFMQAVAKLKAQGMKKLVLDLRHNGGGIMESSIRMADEFLEQGKLIVFTKGRNRPRHDYRASARGFLVNTPVAILVDEWSASASEIFSGALQDNDKGLIIGRRTFGKGLVQEASYFSDGAELRLTVARYYTPTGRSIQKPYKKGGDKNYSEDIVNRYLNGEFMDKDSIKLNDSLKFTTPGGKTVYGGGGIMPDIFVPVDTAGGSPFLYNVRKKGLEYIYAFEYTDKHRSTLSKIKDYKELDKYLDNHNVFADFVKFAKSRKVKASKKDIRISGNILKTQVKALIIRNVIGDDGFYPIINRIDKTFERAVSELSENK